MPVAVSTFARRNWACRNPPPVPTDSPGLRNDGLGRFVQNLVDPIMRIPEKWLRHYCNPPLDAAGLDHVLTMGGLEVEAREPVAAPFSGVVVARILTAEKHPDADRLQVCHVEVGQGEPVQIVCGAPNARAGLVTACALPGAVLPGDFRIKKTKMRGVESGGMLCSGRELGMGDDHAGIL